MLNSLIFSEEARRVSIAIEVFLTISMNTA